MTHAKTLRKAPLSVAIAAILLTSSHVQAQADESDEENKKDIEVIQVRASSFADSLEKSLMNKRFETNSVDTILAEDIADFPDQNLAESLQRIPGVAINRDAGEGREITVRGLNSTFTRVQLNGMQAQSLAAGSGGVQTSRGFDFNVFASELFNQLKVYKTTSAELEEGSLGATVGLRTARPFDFSEKVFAINAQASYNDLSDETEPRFSGLASYVNDDSSIGFLISAAVSKRTIKNEGADTGRWEDDTFGACSACDSDEEVDRISRSWHPRFPRYSDKTDEQERIGITSSLQFILSDSTEVTFDALYANIDASRQEPFMQAISLARTNANGVQQSDVVDYAIDANDTIYAATIADVDVRSEYFNADWESEFTQFSVELEHDFNDDLKMKFLAGTSKSTLDNRESSVIFEHYSENDSRRLRDYADASSAVSYDFSDMTSPEISYSFDTTNPDNWEMSEFRDRLYDAESTTDNVRLDFSYYLNDNIKLKSGATYKEYSYEIEGLRADASFASADEQDGTADGVACGIDHIVDGSDGNVVNFGGQSFFQPGAAQVDAFLGSGCWPYAVRPSDTRSVTEESEGFFVQADFNYDIGDTVLRGNVGVRYVKTDVSSTGIINGTEEVTVENDYSDSLPSINLAYDITDDIIIRAAWAEVMSRPNLSNLNPGGSVSIFGDPRVSYGNPFIEPFRADATDLSIEWYFDEGAVFSVAYFKKEVDSFPTTETTFLPWPEVGLPDSVLGSERDNLIGETFEVRRSVNGEGGDLDGFEIQYQQKLNFLPGPEWMRKFGVITNLTLVDSEVTYGNDRVGPLTGQSDESANFTLYWENDVISTRLSAAYRGEFFSNLSSNDERKWRVVDSSTHLDFSFSYRVSENLKLTLEAINLTDEPIGEYIDPQARRIITEQNTGRQFFLGASYRM
ncbi:TonB-dependent receptor [Alteromonas sp. a30]|uniref:TonB-dependent receptor n=1 Tax=Alteromonas sp. a30 TaxID=2730917 RepID=UPI00227E7248|nr:TonB-dependent receptor [Alteromonas sp. a30]MCY7297193.1 TonB-dependent receptor [Alteromonas sp. a30]